MGSRKEEERNEKIIRGLMKLPPNRRCINCNSLGPQYVCTNFWTFVCMTCSGIHREFTHRVKSVSMSKFTSQEVEALQNGGNQRAREIYLRDWDHERQRLPGNSNVDKVREFIKSVYVDKKYAGGKTHDKPPRDLQRLKSNEEETRRASSYHSYSQSPPYDFQYEDRHYGKQAGVLTRKPGSDRGYYVGKMSSFICSPTRSNERTLEDRFANEGSVSRVSSGGDLFSAGSPNFQKESNTPIQSPSNAFGEDAHQRIDLFSERSASLGSMGSFDSNSISVRSYNSSSLVDVAPETEQAAASGQNLVPIFHKASGSYGSLDQFKAPVVPESNASASPPIDLFQLQETPPPPSAHFFEAPPLDLSASANSHQSTYTTMPVSLDLFAGISQQQSVNSFGHNTVDSSSQKNEGWATFDAQPIAPTQGTGNLTSSVSPQLLGSPKEFDRVSSTNTSTQWPPLQNSSAQGPSSVSDLWKDNGEQYDQSTSAPAWNAFSSSSTPFPLGESNQASEPHEFNMDQFRSSSPYEGIPGSNGVPEALLDPPYTPSVNPLMEVNKSYEANHKSTNPFDLPYDSEMELGNMFLDMGSLQDALPTDHLPSTFIAGVAAQWFPHEPATNFIPIAPPGGLAYMAGQATNAQLENVPTQGPVTSIGGNPFA